MDLSIIIVNFNTNKLTEDCINSIKKNTDGVSFEIIVVDNASSDGSQEYLSKLYPDIKIIPNSDNLGFAKANNKGIRMAVGENILLLNSDTLIYRDCLKSSIQFLKNNPQDGVLGCKVLNQDGTLQYSCYKYPSLVTEIIFFTMGIIKGYWDPITSRKYMRSWDHSSVREVNCVSGCFFLVRKSIFEKIGYLDEDFFMYYEDSEYCRRLKKLTKYRVYYYPNASIVHLHGKSADKVNYKTLKECFRSACLYFKKNNGLFIANVFRLLCRAIWIFEISLFVPLVFFKIFRNKVNMLWQLLLPGAIN